MKNHPDGRTQEFDVLRSIIVGEQNYVDNDDFQSFKKEVIERLNRLELLNQDRTHFDNRIVTSKERILDVVSPQMGKIIRTSLSLQIERINAKIREASSKVSDMFTIKYVWNRILGKRQIQYLDYPNIVQLFIIEKDTGLLLGKFEKEKINDPDIVTGILTSIKVFAESSLNVQDAEVGMIDYGDYFIKMFNYGTFYFALILTGRQNPDFEKFIIEEIDGFAQISMKHLTRSDREDLSFDREINEYFEKTCLKLEKR